MRKEYEKPSVACVEFELEENLMSGDIEIGGSTGFEEGDEDW